MPANDRNMPSCGIRSKCDKLSNYIATCGIFMCYVVVIYLIINLFFIWKH